jgi:hypothetical protein
MKKSVDQMLEERRENDQMVLMFGKFGSLGAKTAQELPHREILAAHLVLIKN